MILTVGNYEAIILSSNFEPKCHLISCSQPVLIQNCLRNEGVKT